MKVSCAKQATRPSITWQVDAILCDQQHYGARSWTDKDRSHLLFDDKERKSGHAELYTSQATRYRVSAREYSNTNEAITGRARDRTVGSSSTLR